MIKQKILLLLSILMVSVTSSAQEEYEALFKKGVDLFRKDLHPFITTNFENFSYLEGLLKIFEPVDTIYVYDGYGNIEIEKNTLTFLEANNKVVTVVNKKWLDSIPLGLSRIERWGFGLSPSDSINFTGGFLSRFKPFRRYSAVCYVNSKELSSMECLHYQFYKRKKANEIRYIVNGDLYMFSSPAVSLSSEKVFEKHNLTSDSLRYFAYDEYLKTIKSISYVPKRLFYRPRFGFSTFGNLSFQCDISRNGKIKSYIVIDNNKKVTYTTTSKAKTSSWV